MFFVLWVVTILATPFVLVHEQTSRGLVYKFFGMMFLALFFLIIEIGVW